MNTLKSFVEHPLFERTILVLIFINAIVLGLETSPAVMSKVGSMLQMIDGVILAIFVIELILRLAADIKGFWRNPWRIFDLFVVGVALIP